MPSLLSWQLDVINMENMCLTYRNICENSRQKALIVQVQKIAFLRVYFMKVSWLRRDIQLEFENHLLKVFPTWGITSAFTVRTLIAGKRERTRALILKILIFFSLHAVVIPYYTFLFAQMNAFKKQYIVVSCRFNTDYHFLCDAICN